MGKKIKRQANCCSYDHPKPGDKVYVIRTEHGWFDGSLAATVVSCVCQGDGTTKGYTVKDNDGIDHYCAKRGDVSKS